MSWRTVAAALVVVFVILFVQTVAVGPLTSIVDGIQESGDYNSEHLEESMMDDMLSAWLTSGLIGAFGIMGWALWRILRREVTRSGGGLG